MFKQVWTDRYQYINLYWQRVQQQMCCISNIQLHLWTSGFNTQTFQEETPLPRSSKTTHGSCFGHGNLRISASMNLSHLPSFWFRKGINPWIIQKRRHVVPVFFGTSWLSVGHFSGIQACSMWSSSDSWSQIQRLLQISSQNIFLKNWIERTSCLQKVIFTFRLL